MKPYLQAQAGHRRHTNVLRTQINGIGRSEHVAAGVSQTASQSDARRETVFTRGAFVQVCNSTALLNQ
jgi:hypothetical protein